ncbi:TPA: type IV pili twitching motility protein PilT [bacterium]|nr:type IV pili twitching motility protein PilT [bacterium]
MLIDELLNHLINKGGSDLHLKVGRVPIIRVKGEMIKTEFPTLIDEDMKEMANYLLTIQQMRRFEEEREFDFSYEPKGALARFRGNLFHQKGKIGAVFRAIPRNVSTIDEMGYSPVLKELAKRHQGLVLVTGPTGSGKSTTLAAMVQFINENRAGHIITIEDPIEFVFEDDKCLINQREIGLDTLNFAGALKRALRQDPDVIMVGEMRDAETISVAMTASETGHLVLSTLHTIDAKQSIDRIIDTFSSDQQDQIRMQIASTLLATISQRLLRRADGSGRVAAMEIMINTPMIKKLIEENRIGAIDKAIEESKSFYNTQSFNQSLFDLASSGVITKEEALANSTNPNDLNLKFQTQGFAASKEKEQEKGASLGLGKMPKPF